MNRIPNSRFAAATVRTARLIPGLLSAVILMAASQAVSSQAHPAAQRSRPRAAKPAAVETAAAAPAPEPPKPDWPVNSSPQQPKITWDSQGLQVQAANSSLRQILNEVATATGAKISGVGQDERVFGVYGPGQARDVLSQILQGTSYNVLMVGDLGQGAPREIVLSARHAEANRPSAAQPTQEAQDEEVEPEPEEPPQQMQPMVQPGQPGAPNGAPGPLHSPQERMMEIQREQMERQRQMQQQMQQMQEQQNQQ